MSNRLGTAATIATSVATLAVLLYIATGPALAILMLVVSAIAFAVWLRDDQRSESTAAIVPYLAVIVISLLLSAVRYWSGYGTHAVATLPALFLPHYASADVTWFVTTVTLPVSLMLLGGYALLRGHAIGRYMAWWTFAFAMADGVTQVAVEFATAGYDHRFFLGALLAVVEIALGAFGWLRLAGRSAPAPEASLKPLTRQATILWSIGFFVFVAAYGVTLYSQAGYLPVIIIVGSMFGGLFAWLRTTAVVPANRLKVVPLYLLMLALFYIHVGEEGLSGFAHGIALISGVPWSEASFFEIIGLVGPAIWVAAALGMWLRQPWGNFLVWFMIVGMILGEPTHHIIFPVMAATKLGVGYTYFGGMVTALFPMIPAIILAASIFADSRRSLRDNESFAGALSTPA
jgi:hypothetical protein